MPLVSKTDAVRVDLSTPGEWVELKRRMSKGEQTRVQACGLKLKMTTNGSVMGVDADMDAEQVLDGVTFLALELGIVGWSFPEELTAENIRLLDPDDYEIIRVQADELWAPRTDDERKNLSANGVTPRKERALSPRS